MVILWLSQLYPFGGLSHGSTQTNHPFIEWMFHEIKHPAIGVPQ